MRFREVRLPKSATCPICSDEPTQKELVEYEAHCRTEGEMEQRPEAQALEIDVEETKGRLDRGEIVLLDVRTPQEYEMARIEGSRLIPLREIPEHLDDLDREAPIVVHCHHGPRSIQATMYLRQQGFESVWSMAGGIDAWSAVVDPSVPRY